MDRLLACSYLQEKQDQKSPNATLCGGFAVCLGLLRFMFVLLLCFMSALQRLL